MKQLNPKKLFAPEILNYRVKLEDGRFVNYVNLDNAATTPPFSCVEKSAKDFLTSYGSVHRGAGAKSQISTTLYEESRETIRAFVGASKDAHVIFTGNTTGAVNQLAYFFSFLPGKVAVSEIEHSSSWLPWVKAEGTKALGRKQVEIKEFEKQNEALQTLGRKQVLVYRVNDQLEFDLDNIEKNLQKNKIKVLVLTAASNVNGYCPPIAKIGRLVHRYGAYFAVDACQFVQHHPINMKKTGIDFLFASGHKFYAPYGGGLLIGPKKFFDHFLPYQIGGGNLPYITESGEFLRYQNNLAHDAGTPNALGAVTMAVALSALKKLGLKNIEQTEKRLAQFVWRALAKNPALDLYVDKKHLTTVIPFNIKNIKAEKVARWLNEKYGIGVRAGSFCSYHLLRRLLKVRNEASIIQAVKRGDKSKIPSLVRASFGLGNTLADARRLVAAINEITSYEKNNRKTS
jgi:cysteine desulfurase